MYGTMGTVTLDLNDILVFAKVVQAGSFVAAARELEMPKSTVSRRVSALEARLEARLLQRTTRTLSLTDVGRTYYQYALRIAGEVDEAELAVTRKQSTPQGLLRLTIPFSLSFLAPMLTAFMQRYPDVQLDVVATDRVVDLVDEGFDVALRAGTLRDSSLVARHLGTLKRVLVASPAFLKRYGTPAQPEDLVRCPTLAFGAGAQRTAWELTRGGKRVTIEVTPRLIANDFEILDAAVRQGLGLALVPLFRCRGDLLTRTLCRVLGEWSTHEPPLTAVYPSTRHLSPKVRAFLDHLREHMTPPPWERGPAP